MTRKMRLSDRAVARLAAVSSEHTVWDTRVTGLGVRVRPSGHRSFVLLDNRNGSSKRRTLGPVTHMTVDEARPGVSQFRPATWTIRPIRHRIPCHSSAILSQMSGFLSVLTRFKPSTRRRTNSALANHLLPAFADMPLDRIGRKDVMAWFDRYSGTAPGGANRDLAVLRQILNHAKVHGHLETNPASGYAGTRNASSTGSCPGTKPVACMSNWIGWLPNARSERHRQTLSVFSTARDAAAARSGHSGGARLARPPLILMTARRDRGRST